MVTEDVESSRFRQAVDWRDSGERSFSSNPEQPRLLYVKELKQMLNGLGEDAIYGLLRSGEIPAQKIGGKWVTTPEAVEAWLERIGSVGSETADLSLVR